MEEKVFEWYLKFAKNNDPKELCNLGFCYENGIGTDKDENKAFELYLESANGNNIIGQRNLGHCYQYGIGISKDKKKAFACYLNSFKGNTNDKNDSMSYECHACTMKDETNAFQWY